MSLLARVRADEVVVGRRSERSRIHADATLRFSPNVPVDAVIGNLSAGGCLLETTLSLEVGSIVSIGVAGIPILRARVVRGAAGQYGCEFLQPLSLEQLKNAGKSDTLHSGAFPDTFLPPFQDPVTELWPLRTRGMVLIGLTLTAWTAIALLLL